MDQKGESELENILKQCNLPFHKLIKRWKWLNVDPSWFFQFNDAKSIKSVH